LIKMTTELRSQYGLAANNESAVRPDLHLTVFYAPGSQTLLVFRVGDCRRSLAAHPSQLLPEQLPTNGKAAVSVL
jgi:hypothetical protein